VGVPRDDAPFFQVDVRQHHAIAGDEPARQPLVQLFAGEIIPPVPGGFTSVAYHKRSEKGGGQQTLARRRCFASRWVAATRCPHPLSPSPEGRGDQRGEDKICLPRPTRVTSFAALP